VCCHDLGLNFSDRVGTRPEVLLIGRYSYRPELTSRVKPWLVSLPALAFSLLFRFQGAKRALTRGWPYQIPQSTDRDAAGSWRRLSILSAVLTKRQP